MCITETTLHLQELYSSAQAFLTQSVKRRNINVGILQSKSTIKPKLTKMLLLHFCSNSRLAFPRSDYISKLHYANVSYYCTSISHQKALNSNACKKRQKIIYLIWLIFCSVYIKLYIARERSNHAPIAQLDRASGYGPEGCGFDLCWAHQ
jgi:hypothetical protein